MPSRVEPLPRIAQPPARVKSRSGTRPQTRPKSELRERLELPLLQELAAFGGTDGLESLAQRLWRYVPPPGVGAESVTREGLRLLLRHTARVLLRRGELSRTGRLWHLTPQGKKRLELEGMPVSLELETDAFLSFASSHKQTQQQLLEIGQMLGRDAALEVEYYDVIWRDRPHAPRFSHVFEVQFKGSVDSALTRLKQAWSLGRSRPILVVADARSERVAKERLESAFHELLPVLQLITSAEVARLHASLVPQHAVLERLGLGGS